MVNVRLNLLKSSPLVRTQKMLLLVPFIDIHMIQITKNFSANLVGKLSVSRRSTIFILLLGDININTKYYNDKITKD